MSHAPNRTASSAPTALLLPLPVSPAAHRVYPHVTPLEGVDARRGRSRRCPPATVWLGPTLLSGIALGVILERLMAPVPIAPMPPAAAIPAAPNAATPPPSERLEVFPTEAVLPVPPGDSAVTSLTTPSGDSAVTSLTTPSPDETTLSAPPTTADRASPSVRPATTSAPHPHPVGQPTEAELPLEDQLASQFEAIELFNRAFELVARIVSPSVVHIEAVKPSRVPKPDGGERGRTLETGSGVLVSHPDAEGRQRIYVLTNHHVVEGAQVGSIQVFLFDGHLLKPTRVWHDAKADVAVLELAPRSDLRPARLGDSDGVQVGSWVMAIGSPFGLKHSVSQGIISARGRREADLQQEGLENQDFLQTDAAINPGNSGGPLVNLKGEVIGLNTAIATSHGGSEGVGFAIPINLAKWIMDQLIRRGKVVRGGIGVDLADLSPQQALVLGLDRPRGVRITRVHPGSPAESAGFQVTDVVLSFNHVEVRNLHHFINLVSMSPIDQLVSVTVWRRRQHQTLEVRIADLDQLRAQSIPQTTPAPSAPPAARPDRPSPTRPSDAAPPPKLHSNSNPQPPRRSSLPLETLPRSNSAQSG